MKQLSFTIHVYIFTHSAQHDFPIFFSIFYVLEILCLSTNNNKVKLCRVESCSQYIYPCNFSFILIALWSIMLITQIKLIIPSTSKIVDDKFGLQLPSTLKGASRWIYNHGQYLQIYQFSIHAILRLCCIKNDADIRRSKNCFKVHRIASLLNFKAFLLRTIVLGVEWRLLNCALSKNRLFGDHAQRYTNGCWKRVFYVLKSLILQQQIRHL